MRPCRQGGGKSVESRQEKGLLLTTFMSCHGDLGGWELSSPLGQDGFILQLHSKSC